MDIDLLGFGGLDLLAEWTGGGRLEGLVLGVEAAWGLEGAGFGVGCLHTQGSTGCAGS